MKKFFVLLCLILSAVLVLSFVSCKKESTDDNDDSDVEATKAEETLPDETLEETVKEPESADELWKLVEEKMNNLSSYEGEISMNSTIYLNGYKMDMHAKGTLIAIAGENDNDYYRFETMSGGVSCADLDYSEEYDMLQAYCDGKYFYSRKDGELSRKFVTEMTADEYDESKQGDLTEEVDIEGCTEKVYTKNDDGTWNLVFSGYTKKNMNTFLDYVEMSDEEFGMSIEDLKITVLADEEYRAENMVIEFVFDADETDVSVPVFKMEAKYSNFDSAEKKTDLLDPADYVEVDDIDVISNITESIEEFASAKEGSFVYDTKQTIKVGSEVYEETEKDTGSFGMVNGGFVFNIEILVNGTENVLIDYKNGVYSVAVGEDVETENITDDDARAVILSVVNGMEYMEEYISDVEVMEDGAYKLIAEYDDVTSFEEFFAEMDVTYKSYSEEYAATFEDDKLVRLERVLKLFGEFSGNGTTEAVEYEVLDVLTINNKSAAENQA